MRALHPAKHALLSGLVVALTALGVTSEAAAAPARPAPVDGRTVEAVLARADRPDSPSVALLAQDLIDLGTAALPKVLDALVLEAQRPNGLSSRRARVVYATCALAGSARWRPIVERWIVPGCSRATLSATYALCAECGYAPEMSFLVRAAASDADGACREDLQRAMTSILVRDPAAFGPLDSLVGTAPASVRPTIVAAVEATKNPDAALLFARWIGARRDLRLIVLPHLARLALVLDKPVADEIQMPVRMLLEQVDGETLPEAIVCAGRLQDYAAVPALTRWLREGDAGVRANALWSLRRISGLVLDEDPALWVKWFADESAWWEHESANAFLALRTGTRAEKMKALRAISCLHAWRDKLVDPVAVLFEDEDPELSVYGARMLGRLGSRLAVPVLLDALESPVESLSDAAHAALEVIAGKKLPGDVLACRELLGARS
jgi:hypothetical protein